MILLLQVAGVALGDSSTEELVIITHNSVQQGELSPVYLRHVFSGQIQFWDNGDKIKVFVLEPSDPNHQVFCKQQLKMFSYQLERLWSQLTYSGQGEPPIIVQSLDALVEAVADTPGAIGYAKPDHVMSNIKVISGDTQ